MRSVILFIVLFASFGSRAVAQILEFNGAWQHMTGDNGLDGFGLGAAAWFSPRVSVNFQYDTVYDNSTIGVFELTSVGLISAKSHLQDFMVGPRIFFAQKKIKKYYVDPFGELRIGGGHLNSTISQVGAPSISASDNSFQWLIGGGIDYVVTSHWAARANIDFLRTHFANSGQSRLQFGIGAAYTFGARH